MARTLPAGMARLDLVSRETPCAPLFLYLDALDLAAVSLRPPAGVRVEVAPAGGHAESAGHRGRGDWDVVVGMDALVFWIFAVVMIVSSLLVVGQRNPMYSVLLLLVSFGALSGLY